MGLFIGIPLLSIGLITPDARAYLTRCLVAFAVVAVTALVVGLGGLDCACFAITAPGDFGWSYPEGVTDKVGFARVGVMHTVSYLGGLLGIFAASAYLVTARIRQSRTAREK